MSVLMEHMKSIELYRKLMKNNEKPIQSEGSKMQEISDACTNSNCKIIKYNSETPNVIVVGYDFSIGNLETQISNIGSFVSVSAKEKDRVFFQQTTEGRVKRPDSNSPRYIQLFEQDYKRNGIKLHGLGNYKTDIKKLNQSIEIANESLLNINEEIAKEYLIKVKRITEKLQRDYLVSESGILTNMKNKRNNYLIAPTRVIFFPGAIKIIEEKNTEYCLITNRKY